jgi:hypothetical protein
MRPARSSPRQAASQWRDCTQRDTAATHQRTARCITLPKNDSARFCSRARVLQRGNRCAQHCVLSGLGKRKRNRQELPVKAFQRSLAIASFMLMAAVVPSRAVSLFPTSTFAPPGGSATFSNVVTAAFTDDYTFTLLEDTFFTSIVTSNSFTPAGGRISGFAAAVFAGTPPSGTLALPGTPPVLAADLVSQTISFAGLLAPGTYFLQVLGTGITGTTAPYAGTVELSEVSGVPIPGAFPLFTTGLCLVGMGLLRRRKKARIQAQTRVA